MSLGYITKKEFLKEFKIERHTFEKWVSEKGLPVKRIGYKTYIQKNELEEWLKEFSINEPSLLDLKSIFN
jgi:excisionase family DNA binding protein